MSTTPTPPTVVEPSGSAKLRLQRQPTPNTCVHACLAMVLDVPVDRVIKTFGEASMGHDELMAALRACGILHVQLVSPRLVISGWHFAVVPSLNFRGGNHQILIHNNMDDGGLSVLDPTCQDAYAADGSNLKSWTDLVFVRPGGRLPNADITDPAHTCEFFDGWNECGGPASHLWNMNPEPMYLCAHHAVMVAKIRFSDVVPIEEAPGICVANPEPDRHK